MARLATLGLAVVLMNLLIQTQAVNLDLFYPFGTHFPNGTTKKDPDDVMSPGDDVSTGELYLYEDIVLYNRSYSSIYVSHNSF